jgi:hypothetical protein
MDASEVSFEVGQSEDLGMSTSRSREGAGATIPFRNSIDQLFPHKLVVRLQYIMKIFYGSFLRLARVDAV